MKREEVFETIMSILQTDVAWEAFWATSENEGVEVARKKFCTDRAAQIAQIIESDGHVRTVLAKRLQSAVCEVIMAATAIEKECSR